MVIEFYTPGHKPSPRAIRHQTLLSVEIDKLWTDILIFPFCTPIENHIVL